jgi:phage-related minor tail protein
VPNVPVPQLGGAPTQVAGRLGLPRMAEGGIVSSPTLALIGEAGPEAVVPLDRMQSGGGITINVTGGLATSAEIGESVVNALRAYSRSAGPLQLQVA